MQEGSFMRERGGRDKVSRIMGTNGTEGIILRFNSTKENSKISMALMENIKVFIALREFTLSELGRVE